MEKLIYSSALPSKIHLKPHLTLARVHPPKLAAFLPPIGDSPRVNSYSLKHGGRFQLRASCLFNSSHGPLLNSSSDSPISNGSSSEPRFLKQPSNANSLRKRSLARSAYNRGDYERSKVLWESAMALNSLYPDGWFALGAAALKARDINKALDGFTRAVQLDPDNGEAWNNIACLCHTTYRCVFHMLGVIAVPIAKPFAMVASLIIIITFLSFRVAGLTDLPIPLKT